jgi:hypothetical protein
LDSVFVALLAQHDSNLKSHHHTIQIDIFMVGVYKIDMGWLTLVGRLSSMTLKNKA